MLQSDGLTKPDPNSPAVRKTRVVSYAWGERYLDELLTFTIPAALSPSNLPSIVDLVPTEVVLLIEEKHQERVAKHPTIQHLRELCQVRLMGLDDLIVGEDKYGMTLTYALHRAVHSVGAEATKTYFLFLNADFVVADGSLRNVLLKLMKGERLIAAPSYCVVSHAVLPELPEFFDRDKTTLSASSRALAKIALLNLHDTVRGKP